MIEGRVQGVLFRASTEAKARTLDLTGWIRNLPSGNVEAVVEGPEDHVNEFLEWCKIGPIAAHVKNIIVEEKEYRGEFDDFRVLK